MSEPTREDAWNLVCEWIVSASLRKHVLGVEAAMRAYARDGGEDEELWGITGLVHDLDYERYPDLETDYLRHALSELEARGYPAEVIDAVAWHAEVPRGAAQRQRSQRRCSPSTSFPASSPPARWCAPRGSRG